MSLFMLSNRTLYVYHITHLSLSLPIFITVTPECQVIEPEDKCHAITLETHISTVYLLFDQT